MNISKLEKQEKLKKILDHIEKNDVTAYSISQGTGISDMGILKIMKGQSKNPNGSTVLAIYDFYLTIRVATRKPILKSWLKMTNFVKTASALMM